MSSKTLSFKNGLSPLRVFSFFKPVKTKCTNCLCEDSLENECESSCFETNEIFCLNNKRLITNSCADSDKISFALLNSLNNLNELDSLKSARSILLNDVKFKSGFDSGYALSGSSGEIRFNTVSKISVYP